MDCKISVNQAEGRIEDTAGRREASDNEADGAVPQGLQVDVALSSMDPNDNAQEFDGIHGRIPVVKEVAFRYQ